MIGAVQTPPATRPDGVLFDLSGTLFHIESAAEALYTALGPEFVHLADEVTRRGGINGSDVPPGLSAADQELWARRDLGHDAHRAAYSGQAVRAGLTPAQAAALYERGVSAAAWQPYPDTVAVLRYLHRVATPVAIVSNIGWDPRPVLRRYGVTDDVTALVLSDERGVVKPDPAMFAMACAEIGIEPQRCVMVGDNAVTDGAATALGIRFVQVSADVDERGDHDLLRAVGAAIEHR